MSHLELLVCNVTNALNSVDKASDEYQKNTGLHCPSECGKCCMSPTVEATVLEMLPLAQELYKLGKATQVYSVLSENPLSKTCVIFASDTPNGAKGRCGHYAFRPSVCRLFGFAGIKQKDGKTVLAACQVHKKTIPEIVKKCDADTENTPPLFSDWHEVLQRIEPHLGSRSLPINNALKTALEIASYSQGSDC